MPAEGVSETMNLQETIGVVAEMRERVLARQRFRGYSGVARAAGGTLAVLSAGLAHLLGLGKYDTALLVVWGLVFIGALVLNYGAVAWWWATGRGKELTPALEPLPIFLVGGLVSIALIRTGVPQVLPGVWMALFGLTQFTAKYALPRTIRWVGWFYILAGAVSLWRGEWAWREPLALGMVFFAGEWAGGLILHAETRTTGKYFKTNPLPAPGPDKP